MHSLIMNYIFYGHASVSSVTYCMMLEYVGCRTARIHPFTNNLSDNKKQRFLCQLQDFARLSRSRYFCPASHTHPSQILQFYIPHHITRHGKIESPRFLTNQVTGPIKNPECSFSRGYSARYGSLSSRPFSLNTSKSMDGS